MVTVARLPMRSHLEFELTVVAADPLRATVRASGALDLSARDSIVEALERQRDSGRRFVRLELADVTFMDCSCLRVLVAEHQRFLAARGQLLLTGVGPRISRLLELTALDQVLFAVTAEPCDPADQVGGPAVSSRSRVSESPAGVVRQRSHH